MPSPTKKTRFRNKKKATRQGKRRKYEIRRTNRKKVEELGKKLGLIS